MSDLRGRIDELERRGDRLCGAGKWGARIALCLLGTLIALWWPEPAGNEAIGTYLSVPDPLFTLLESRGVAVHRVGYGLVQNGVYGWTACIIPTALVAWIFLKRVIPLRVVRYTIVGVAFVTMPIWLSSVVPNGAPMQVRAAREGILVDHAGVPRAHEDGTSRPPLAPYVLDPQTLRSDLADQARFVLAQQAYREGSPDRMRTHLEALSGHWHPDRQDTIILGLMLEHAAARGRPVSGIAPALTSGAPHSAWRLAARHNVIWLAVACFAAGIALHLLGTWRKRAAGTLAKRLASVAGRAGNKHASQSASRTERWV